MLIQKLHNPEILFQKYIKSTTRSMYFQPCHLLQILHTTNQRPLEYIYM